MFDAEAVTKAYEEERATAGPVYRADELPFGFEDITSEWLTATICRNVPDAAVLSYRLDVPDNGTSNRRRIFLEFNRAGQLAGLPNSVFCKASQDLANRILLGKSNANEGEVLFYNEARRFVDIQAPISYFANFDSVSQNSIVILADLGPDTIFCTHTTPIDRQRAESQLLLLAKLHGTFLTTPEREQVLAKFQDWQLLFAKLWTEEWRVSCDHGFMAAEDVIPARLFARAVEVNDATARSVALDRDRARTLTHGDTHLRNWCISPGGQMGLNDWQALSRAHWSRDVIYTISTALTVEDRRRWDMDLIAYYHDCLQEITHQQFDLDQLIHDCRTQLFSILSYWTTTLKPAPGWPNMQPRDSTVELIRRIATALDDLDSFDSLT